MRLPWQLIAADAAFLIRPALVAHASDIYLTGLGGLLTIVYMAGLIFRPAKQHARLGIDSIAVLTLYVIGVIGVIGLIALPR